MTPDQEVGHFVVGQSQKILELTKRAEAAELALQKEKSAAEQLRVQLAGCSVAALGWAEGEQRAEPGDYGYSASYQDVIDLRVKWLESELALLKYQQRAKELKLQLGLTEEAHHSDVVAKISKLAQARQQAVADLRNVLIAIPISNELRGNRYDCEDTHTLHIWSPPLDKSWDVIIPKVKP